ncbi:hypothetical protein E4U60_002799 [Claviceps pazoutovae]|uniref:Uncharacterized protein n=1 Tax=Claviceps pazoutovae TaxID=1649127 RepID=A0A9P7SGK1_9HYPO|nr:hypothetical protein E4U60_002799 [Claviceps pazoutovae]
MSRIWIPDIRTTSNSYHDNGRPTGSIPTEQFLTTTNDSTISRGSILGTPRSALPGLKSKLDRRQTTRQIGILSESAPTTSAMPVSSSAIREHGKLYIEEDFSGEDLSGEDLSGEDLSDEEDTADFIDRTPPASLLKPSILKRACQRNLFLIVCFIPKPKAHHVPVDADEVD